MHGTDQLPHSTSKCETQSGKIKFAQCRILHALHKLRKKRARKTTWGMQPVINSLKSVKKYTSVTTVFRAQNNNFTERYFHL